MINHNKMIENSMWSFGIPDFSLKGCRDGAVVRALASHQCGPGSIPRLSVIRGLSLLLFQFLLSSKTNISLDLR